MQFKEALKKAGLANPGRTTWKGKAADGTAVFTIWSHEVRKIDGRLFAWWDHNDRREPYVELAPRQRSRGRTFIKMAAANIGKSCRAVIVHLNTARNGVASADYPHARMARAQFRTADLDALQFIVELLPPKPMASTGLPPKSTGIMRGSTTSASVPGR